MSLAKLGRRVRNVKVTPTRIQAQVLVGLDPENYHTETYIDIAVHRFVKGEPTEGQKALDALEAFLGKAADASIARAMKTTEHPPSRLPTQAPPEKKGKTNGA